jgi:hypothetical protein
MKALLSKPVTDTIDCILAERCGFTDEGLDFTIHCDIQYRLGQEAEGEDEA